MKVWKLIIKLCSLPMNADVGIVVDGAYAYDVDHVYESNGGPVLVTYAGAHVYDESDCPKGDKLDEMGGYLPYLSSSGFDRP